MNCVTFETAKRLKEAGFPQPDLKAGQHWYTPAGNLVIVGVNFAAGHCFCYAPTATELLPDGWYLANDMGYFIAIQHPCDPSSNGFGNSNPAEAAAAAWLHVNATKTTETI